MTIYFGPHEEELVKEYIKTRDEKLYNASIHPLLKSITYGVRDKYNFQPKAYYTSPSVINGCISLLWEKLLTTYDPGKGHKAYSYLTRVAHNFFCEVFRKINKSDSTLLYTTRQVEQIWNASHSYSESREQMFIDEHNSRARKRIVGTFISDYLFCTPAQEKKILESIDELPNPHKKSINKILFKTLDLKNYAIRRSGPIYRPTRSKVAENKRLNIVKRRFKKEKISLHKSTGVL